MDYNYQFPVSMLLLLLLMLLLNTLLHVKDYIFNALLLVVWQAPV